MMHAIHTECDKDSKITQRRAIICFFNLKKTKITIKIAAN